MPIEKNQYLVQQRAQRIEHLVANRMYVVIADNRKQPGSVLYYQDTALVVPDADRRTSTSQWTRFLANAKGFATQEEAKAVVAQFKYGSPRFIQLG